MNTTWQSRFLDIGGIRTHFLEAGDGEPLVLLHGGEFGACAEIAWEQVIGRLAERYRVIAPDILGFGQSEKVVDFVDGRGWRLRHLAAFCAALGIESADFVGNSMGGAMLLADVAAEHPLLPIRRMVTICGGGEVENNSHMAALMDYDATFEGMRRIVAAMFHDPKWAMDDEYVRRRYDSSVQPGAWESVASARFRRPGRESSRGGEMVYDRVLVPTLIIEGEHDKLKPSGWAGRLAARLPDAHAAVVSGSGHCPQIEQPEAFLSLLRTHLGAKGKHQYE